MTEKNETACSKARISLLLAVIVGLCILLNRWTKRLALQHLPPETMRSFLLGPVEPIRIKSHDAVFDMLQGQMIFFYGIAAVIYLFVICMLYRLLERKGYVLLVISPASLIGGTLGSLCDHVMRGSVVDFFSSTPISFPVFNVADTSVTCAVAVFILLFYFYCKEEGFLFLK